MWLIFCRILPPGCSGLEGIFGGGGVVVLGEMFLLGLFKQQKIRLEYE